jgi:hypothetical protein
MSVRNFVTAPVAAHLASHPTLEVMIVSREGHDQEQIAKLPGAPISWAAIVRPFRQSFDEGLPLAWRLRIPLADLRIALGHYLSMVLVFRFNTIKGFRGFRDRLKQSRGVRRLAFAEGLPFVHWLGFPFPKSTWVFGALRRLYFSSWQRHPLVEDLFERFNPDVLVIAHLQHAFVTPYVLAARARRIRILGINGSWDQPTTKGPMVPYVDRILAQSRQVADDLTTYHDVPPSCIEVVGWPQMDIYAGGAASAPRAEFMQRLGLTPASRYILVAAYGERLGPHEFEMCRALQREIARGTFGPNAVLYIRCHPLHRRWCERLGPLNAPPQTIVEAPDLGSLDYLADLIRHAEVVIASGSTINLDAVALDTPSIAVAFEEEDVPYYDRAGRRYDMEHLAAVMASGGIRKVRSLEALVEAVRKYMADRSRDAQERAALRRQHLAPLDGNSSLRIAERIGRFAHERVSSS